MIYPAISSPSPPFMAFMPTKLHKSLLKPSLRTLYSRRIVCFQNQNPNAIDDKPVLLVKKKKKRKAVENEKENGSGNDNVNGGSPALGLEVGRKEMLLLCGVGYWVQGFRCFPWLALNFHMANNLNLNPSMLQLVQYSANLPMLAKPLYGIISDAIYIGGAHRIPYVSVGVLLQVVSWSLLASGPAAREVLPNLIACVLLSNLGASITEVAKDALLAEYGKKQKICGLQSYAFMALATGGIVGNLMGGFFLQKMAPRVMFIIFSSLLSLQLAISLSTREDSLGIKHSDQNLTMKCIAEDIRKQASDLIMAISDESILRPLIWIVGSIAMVPMLSGSIFCYQTQCLKLDPMIIGLSKVTGQLMLLSATVLYNRKWKKVGMRKMIGLVQIIYASSLLLDLILVKQINVRLGISNEAFTLCFSSLAEILAQFKLLPFSVLFATLCPKGCEGSLTSFLASALCLSSIVSGFLGVGLASLLGVTSGDFSGLTTGILLQFFAALVPLRWIHLVPMSQSVVKKQKRGMSRKARRNRRIGKVVLGSIYAYRRERERDPWK
ncbi:hypothetical protein PIB30_094209 [Stylosanthes scabra]|uniref:Folate-biopterin transporter 8, chloroplastic n=1 Tax=Stylosanthes scabra TaxID=79078 RepID=A0ABU6UXR4_9FABA|nr:hypothetical protein [Stylosanthes scabra]